MSQEVSFAKIKPLAELGLLRQDIRASHSPIGRPPGPFKNQSLFVL
jgi:hypothetical protein